MFSPSALPAPSDARAKRDRIRRIGKLTGLGDAELFSSRRHPSLPRKQQRWSSTLLCCIASSFSPRFALSFAVLTASLTAFSLLHFGSTIFSTCRRAGPSWSPFALPMIVPPVSASTATGSFSSTSSFCPSGLSDGDTPSVTHCVA